ncbi:MAG: hydroxymethylglutaryl-CoA lyase [Paracoccaceae bacterium]
MVEAVEIFEVGPRDGLQNENRAIPTAQKIALVDMLSGVGYSRIEVASFVSPKWVAQMADGAKVLAGINRAIGVSYAALTPNMLGFERAVQANADEIAVFASASEGFSHANINCSIIESLARYRPVVQAANAANIQVRGYVSCVVDCPFDGPADPSVVANVASALFRMGCYEISLGDTTGKATPAQTIRMLDAVLKVIPAKNLAGHFHDTGGRALENIEAALDLGIRVFDASVAGLGGCPFVPGAPGNVATEAVHARLTELGFDTGLSGGTLQNAVALAKSIVKR